MTGTDRIIYCEDCNIEVRHVDACPMCGNQELKSLDRKRPRMYTMETVRDYIAAAISAADGYIKSEYECFKCNGAHYMVWPGVRSKDNYSEVEPTLVHPRCPIEVWRGADVIAFSSTLEDFLRSLEVKNG